MTTLTQEQIKEIASELECGFCCYYNQSDNELLFVPNPDDYSDIDPEAWQEEYDKIEENYDRYKLIEPPRSYESFKIMEEFIEALPEGHHLRARLTNALNKRKPFREFKFVIDNSGDYRQKWFHFKSHKLQEYVVSKLAYDGEEEE
jgi:hypothetical protein